MAVVAAAAQTTGGTVGYSNGPTMDLPASVPAGSLAVVIVDQARGGDVPTGVTVSDTESGTWTEAYDEGSGDGWIPRGGAYWRLVGPDDNDATVTVTFGTETNYSVSLLVFTGADWADPIGAISSRNFAAGTSAAWIPGGASTEVEGSRVLGVCMAMNPQTSPFGVPTGYTVLTDRYGANNYRNHATFLSAALTVGSTVDPPNSTLPVSTNYTTRAMEIRAAVGSVVELYQPSLGWVPAVAEVYNGSAWVPSDAETHDGSAWV